MGIAGYGIVGQRRHNSISKFKNFRVTAICDKNLNAFNNIKKNIKKLRILKTYHQLVAENIDVLFVCLPNNLAAKVTYLAIKKNIHVFCEKPPAKEPSELRKIVNIIKKRKNLKLMYGFNHRYHRSVIEAKKIIDTKKFGKIINMKGIYGKSQMISYNDKNHPSFWRTKRKISGGGVLLDQGIHMLDLMRYLGGELKVMASEVSNNMWNYNVEDNAYALLKGQNNIVAFINSSATQWKHRFNLELNFEKGNIELDGILSGTKSYGKEKLIITKADPKNDRGQPKQINKFYRKDNSWYDEINYFFRAIQKNKNIEQGTLEDALKTLSLVFNIYYMDKKWRKKYNIKKNF